MHTFMNVFKGKRLFDYRIFPFKRVLTFAWTNLNSLYSKMLCVKCDRNWSISSRSGEEDAKMNFFLRQNQGQRQTPGEFR